MSKDLRFPIGQFEGDFDVTPEIITSFIKTISDLPARLKEAVEGLDDAQLDTEYRPDGWTVRQVVHHVADSHINAFCRFKLALTEDLPTIRPYYEDRWARLADSDLPLDVSFRIIEGVHFRWATILKSMSDGDFAKRLIHPESGEWRLDKFLGQYDWHSRHHTAHITDLRSRKGW
ncbi:MAG: putative metal-dependent hydrolase [Pyrinomonadaceae bacterium]